MGAQERDPEIIRNAAAEMITEFERQLAAFAEALHQLHIESGAPPHSTISRRARDAGRYSLPASSLSEVFAGKRLPKRDFLTELVRQLSPDDRQLPDEWHRRWTQAKQAERRALFVRNQQKPKSTTSSERLGPVFPTGLTPQPESDNRPDAGKRRAASAERPREADSAMKGAARSTTSDKDFKAAYSLGRLYESQERFGDAEVVYRRAWEQGDQAAAHSLGRLFEGQERFGDAEVVYRRAWEQGDQAAAYSLGRLFEGQERFGDAEVVYLRILEQEQLD
ncbi:hypothetical protein ACGFOW_16145 [Streptomyces rubiginosohelvolus]|uniref:hypothetical protein n=1 Tax=Streptomyces rubiginosohelvolus TaxID=67362 RepID=UPI0037103647